MRWATAEFAEGQFILKVKTLVQGIIQINSSLAKQIDVTERETNQSKERLAVETFPVPFDLEEIKENSIVHANTPSYLSKEQLINQAFKFHSQGNISEARKYYY